MSSAGPPAPLAALLKAVPIIRVATLTASGGPHVAPYWFSWDGEQIVLDTLENRTVRNIRGCDRVTVLVESSEEEETPGSGLIRGRARCYDERDAPASVGAAIAALRAAHADEIASPAFQAYAETITRAPVYVAITPVAWGWVSDPRPAGAQS